MFKALGFERGRGEREARERKRGRNKRLRALRHARGHTLRYIGVCDQVALAPSSVFSEAFSLSRVEGLECRAKRHPGLRVQGVYRGTSLIRNRPPPMTTIGP